MVSRKKLEEFGKIVLGNLYSKLSSAAIERPIFIIGCGRSGTTIFGTVLSHHRSVTYLNEPRYIWFSSYPETDVWTRKTLQRNGRVYLNASDVDDRKSEKLRRLFHLETVLSGHSVLIEKLPMNNFRLDFIKAIFPEARFIHIYRNGLEVAKSIETLSNKGRWYAWAPYKWNRIVEYADTSDFYKSLLPLCSDYFYKGLYEWRLSTEAAVEFLSRQDRSCYHELNYSDLMDRPEEVVGEVLDFIGLERDERVNEFIRDNIARKTKKLGNSDISETARKIGGELLELSMDGAPEISTRYQRGDD